MLNNKYIKINRKYIYETRLVLIHFTDCKLTTDIHCSDWGWGHRVAVISFRTLIYNIHYHFYKTFSVYHQTCLRYGTSKVWKTSHLRLKCHFKPLYFRPTIYTPIPISVVCISIRSRNGAWRFSDCGYSIYLEFDIAFLIISKAVPTLSSSFSIHMSSSITSRIITLSPSSNILTKLLNIELQMSCFWSSTVMNESNLKVYRW